MNDADANVSMPRLEGFYWVARTGGFAAAARAFPHAITQPAVHQQVKKLERTLGVALFERIGKDRMQLTVAGQVVYDFCRPFFERWPSVVRAIRSGEHGGELRIGAQPLTLRHLMPAWIKRAQRRHADAVVHLCELSGIDIGPLVRGDIDLAVGYLPERPAGIEARRVGSLHPFLVLPRTHSLAKARDDAVVARLAGERFVAFPPGHPARVLQDAALADAGCAPGDVMTAGTVESILAFVEADLGFSLIPYLDPAGPRGRGLAARPLVGTEPAPIDALWRAGGPPNPLLEAMLAVAPSD